MEEAIKQIEATFGPAKVIPAHRIEKWLGIKDLSKTSMKIRMVGNRRVVSVLTLARWLS